MGTTNINKKRLTDHLYSYWYRIKGSRKFPALEDVDHDDLLSMGGDVFILEVVPTLDSITYKFLYKGVNLTDDSDQDASGKFIKDLVVGFVDSETDKYNQVVESKEVLFEEQVTTNPANNETIKYRQIILPLGPTDDGPVNAILGGMRFVLEHTE